MKLHNIRVENFLSLRHCQLDKLNPHRNFLVGPNGSGKTTVFRLIRMVRDVFAGESEGRRPALDQWCTRGVVPPALDVCMSIEFDMPWEQELITAFLCTALSKPETLNTALAQLQNQQGVQLSREQYLFFTQWLMQNIRPETVPFFFQGDLRVTYRGEMYEYLRLSYTFMCQEKPITIMMGLISGSGGTLCKGDPPEFLPGGRFAGNAFLAFLQVSRGQKESEEGGALFEFFNYRPGTDPASLDTEALFHHLADQCCFLQVESATPQYALPTYRILSQATGIDFSQPNGRSLSFAALLSLLLNRAFVFTNNVRTPLSPLIEVDIMQAFSQQRNIDDEQQIPLWLFRLKNGDLEEQARFRRIQRTFRDVMGGEQCFDLIVKQPSPQRVGFSQPPTPTLDVRVIDAEGDLPLLYHGAGAWEALVLSTLLDESAGKVILLDEPAANLHPGMQRKLLEVLHTAPGQVIVITHSAQLLPTHADEFRLVHRMQKTQLGTQILGLENSHLVSSDALEKKLHVSTDIPGLLFSNGVILVEGPTELGALSEWFPRSTVGGGRTLADLNIALYAVGGKDDFSFYLRFLTAFGVSWVAICDGDALPPNTANNRHIWEILKDLKLIEDIPADDSSFDMLKSLAEGARMYTANASSDGNFETIPVVQQYLCNSGKQLPKGKSVLKGRAIAQNIPCPPEIDEILHKVLKALNARRIHDQ